jgi:hypothetical protein
VLALARVAQAAGIGLYGGTMLEGTVDRGFSARLVDAAAAVGYRDVRPAAAERRYCQRAAHLCRRSGGAAANAGLGVELDEDKLHSIPASVAGTGEKMLFKVDMTVNIPLDFPPTSLRKLNNEKKPIRNNYSVKANGDISGASPAFTPMSVFSMFKMPKSCIKY